MAKCRISLANFKDLPSMCIKVGTSFVETSEEGKEMTSEGGLDLKGEDIRVQLHPNYLSKFCPFLISINNLPPPLLEIFDQHDFSILDPID